jgi:2-polyprenyl-6-methoxyphenol hydroxylase-like FAD-dependent oxidoreductase
MNLSKKFAIIGAGIGGLTLAIAMQRKGFDVTVYENAPEIKPLGAGLGLAANAMKAFYEIGIGDQILKAGKKLKSLEIRSQKGRILNSADSEKMAKNLGVTNNFAIHRADLHEVLLHQVKPGTVQLGKGCIDFVQTESGIAIKFGDGTSAFTDYMIACDGINSKVRKKFLPECKPRYSGYTCWRAVIDSLPPNFDWETVSETWGKDGRFGIVPLINNRVYWFACINAPQHDLSKKSYSAKDLQTNFKEYHPLIPQLLSLTKDSQLIWSDIIDLAPLKRFAFGNVVLMGDAAHATTPNMGQGACMAIEDAVILSNMLLSGGDVKSIFQQFETRRIGRTTKIVEDSWRLGKVAQVENSLLIGLRNTVLRLTPPGVAEKQMKSIADISFV